MKRVLENPKKIVSILLMFLMIFSVFPVGANAVGPDLVISDWDTDSAAPSLPDHLEPGEVWTDKSVEYKGDGRFTVTLTALGKNLEDETREPVDVVLLLDTSASMEGVKLDSLKDAATMAVDILLGVSPENPGGDNNGNRVAIVPYSTNARSSLNFTDDRTRLYNKINNRQNGLIAGGATNIQNGLLAAETLISGRSQVETNKPVIILFSDGQPTYYHNNFTGHTPENRQGDGKNASTTGVHVWQTILQAMEAKANIPALKIYTIGFDVDDNEHAEATLMPTAQNTGKWTWSAETRVTEQTRVAQYYQDIDKTQWHRTVNTYTSSAAYVGDKYEAPTDPVDISDDPAWEQVSGYSESPETERWEDALWYRYGSIFDVGEEFTIEISKKAFTRKIGYYNQSRTRNEYRNAEPFSFNHKYWEDGSRLVSHSNDELLDAFTSIANAAGVAGKKPLKKINGVYSDIVVTDVLGEGFEVAGKLPEGVVPEGDTLKWTIKGSGFNTIPYDSDAVDIINQVSFDVQIVANEAGTYYTNYDSETDYGNLEVAGARAIFTPAEDNPFYGDDGGGKEFVTDGQATLNMFNSGWLTLTERSEDEEPSDIKVTKTVNGEDQIAVRSGTRVTYRVEVTNEGDPITSLTLKDRAFGEAGFEIGDLVLVDGAERTPLKVSSHEGDEITISFISAPKLHSIPQEVESADAPRRKGGRSISNIPVLTDEGPKDSGEVANDSAGSDTGEGIERPSAEENNNEETSPAIAESLLGTESVNSDAGPVGPQPEDKDEAAKEKENDGKSVPIIDENSPETDSAGSESEDGDVDLKSKDGDVDSKFETGDTDSKSEAGDEEIGEEDSFTAEQPQLNPFIVPLAELDEEAAPENPAFENGMSVEMTYSRVMTANDGNIYRNTVTAATEKGDTDTDSAVVRITQRQRPHRERPPVTPDDSEGEEDVLDEMEEEEEETGVLDETDKDDESGTPEEDAGVAGDSDKLPQTGGISAATLMGLFGVMMTGGGGTAYIKLKRKSLAKEKNN